MSRALLSPDQLAGDPNATLIDMLSDLLAAAQAGRLQSFIGTGFAADGSRIVVWADFHPDAYQMAGSLAWMQAEYMQRRSAEQADALQAEKVYGG